MSSVLLLVQIILSIVAVSCTWLAFKIYRIRTNRAACERFTENYLDRRGNGQKWPHSVLDCSPFASLADYTKKFGGGGVKQTMEKQIDRKLAAHSMTVRTLPRFPASVAHFNLIFQHERKFYSLPRALAATCWRFLMISLMVGSVDEYRDEKGRLIACLSSVVKGSTMRVTFFYQRPSFAKLLIWHHAIRASIQRAIAMKLQFVDAGPFMQHKHRMMEQHANTLAKFGFVQRQDWADVCNVNVSNPYRYDLPTTESLALQQKRALNESKENKQSKENKEGKDNKESKEHKEDKKQKVAAKAQHSEAAAATVTPVSAVSARRRERGQVHVPVTRRTHERQGTSGKFVILC